MSANQPKSYQAATARIREQDANFAGMLRQKLEQEKRAILAERECEQYRQVLVDNEAYCESMMTVRDDAIARAERAEAKLSVCEEERDKARAIVAASPTAFLLYEKWFGLPAAVNELPEPDRLEWLKPKAVQP